MRSGGNAPRRGFTLAELLVSLGIITVITGFMLANFRGGQQSAELRFAAEILVNQLREVQSEALSGRLVSVCSGGTDDLKVCEPGAGNACQGGTCQRRVPSGYGIRLTTDLTSYQLFYDTNGNGIYDDGEALASYPFVQTNTVKLESIAGLPATTDLVFKPPDGQLTINGAQTPDVVDISLLHKAGQQRRHVKINRLTGKIEHD